MITGGVSPQSRAVLLIVASLQTSSLRFDLLSSQESHIMLLGDSHSPHVCSTLSLSVEIHSQQYAAVATLTCGDASQGPLLIV